MPFRDNVRDHAVEIALIVGAGLATIVGCHSVSSIDIGKVKQTFDAAKDVLGRPDLAFLLKRYAPVLGAIASSVTAYFVTNYEPLQMATWGISAAVGGYYAEPIAHAVAGPGVRSKVICGSSLLEAITMGFGLYNIERFRRP